MPAAAHESMLCERERRGRGAPSHLLSLACDLAVQKAGSGLFVTFLVQHLTELNSCSVLPGSVRERS